MTNRYRGTRPIHDTGRVSINPPPVTRRERRKTVAAVVADVVVATVIGLALAAVLAHGLAGGFRTPHHVAVTGGK